MSRQVRVHHFVLADVVRPQSQSWRAADLFGASHWVDVPEDTELPYTVTRLNAFTRFYLEQAGPTDFRIRVRWIDAPGKNPRVVGNFGPFTVPFAPDVGVCDWSFNLQYLRLQGVGLHRVDLICERPDGWDAGNPVRMATTYFVVER
jgi:hypothetical protein